MKKQLLCLALAAATAATATAIPARRGFIKAIGPDGDTIAVQRVGNAFSHHSVTADGNVVMRRADGTYAYATLSAAGRTVESPAPVSLADFRALRAKAPRKARRAPGRLGTFPGTSFPAKGKQKALVILVEFADRKFELGDHAHDYFTDMLNKDDFSEYGATGGVHKYFMDSSNGQFDCRFDLFGPVTLAHNLAYYGENDENGDDMHPEEMVVEACRQLDPQIDFTQYDRDNDGIIDNVYIIYAGRGEASDIFEEHPELIWPHSWEVGSLGLRFDGKLLNTYGCSNEWEDIFDVSTEFPEVIGENPDGIGTFVHEFSHILGLPDLYKTVDDNSETYVTPGEWSVLDYGPYNNNGRTPPAYSAFERNALGWISLTDITADSGNVTIAELNSSNAACAITNPLNSSEFFLLESRRRTGWDAYLPGDGMLVWHVDYDPSVWTDNTVNNRDSHQHVDLVEADGKANKDVRDAADAFPGSRKVTSWRPRWWSDGYAGLTLTDIAAGADGSVTFNAAPSSAVNPGPNNPAGDFLTVSDIIYGTITDREVTVRGYIAGFVKNSPLQTGCVFNSTGAVDTNIILADSENESDPAAIIPVHLPKGDSRSALNLKSHPENLGRYVEITGTHSKYFGEAGVKNVTSHRFIGSDGIISVDFAQPEAADVIFDLQGRRVSKPVGGLYIINGRKIFLK